MLLIRSGLGLARAPPVKVDLVFSQCYGAQYGRDMALDIATYPLPRSCAVQVACHGLGEGKTTLVHKSDATRWRFDHSEFSYHKELLAWFVTNFGPRPPAGVPRPPLTARSRVLLVVFVLCLVFASAKRILPLYRLG
jgi:hypothetical protein